MPDTTPRKHLDEFLTTYLPEQLEVRRLAKRYDLIFREGQAEVHVSVRFEHNTFDVNQASTPKLSSRGVSDAAVLYARARIFITTISKLGFTEYQ